LRRAFPHLKFKDVRGNLNTRLQKLDDGKDYDGLILAVAGLSRLGFNDRIHQVLDPSICLYAVGQGALAVECRESDPQILEMTRSIHDENTQFCCEAERALLRELEGGCQVPVGVFTETTDGKTLLLKGIVLNLDGSKVVKGELSGEIRKGNELGKTLAEQLKKAGGEEILKEVFEATRDKQIKSEDE